MEPRGGRGGRGTSPLVVAPGRSPLAAAEGCSALGAAAGVAAASAASTASSSSPSAMVGGRPGSSRLALGRRPSTSSPDPSRCTSAGPECDSCMPSPPTPGWCAPSCGAEGRLLSTDLRAWSRLCRFLRPPTLSMLRLTLQLCSMPLSMPLRWAPSEPVALRPLPWRATRGTRLVGSAKGTHTIFHPRSVSTRGTMVHTGGKRHCGCGGLEARAGAAGGSGMAARAGPPAVPGPPCAHALPLPLPPSLLPPHVP